VVASILKIRAKQKLINMETLMLTADGINTCKNKLVLLLTVALMTFSTAIAGEKDTLTGDDNATVKCLRVEEGQVYFNVKFDNTTGAKFDVLVNDENGETLYHGVFNEKNFSKVFKAPSEHGKLTIIIRNTRDKAYHKFELSSEARYVQEAIVKRM
jgi:hypothetical protein